MSQLATRHTAPLPRLPALHLIFRSITPGLFRAEHNGMSYEVHRIEHPVSGIAEEYLAQVKTKHSGLVQRINKFRTSKAARGWLNDQATAAQHERAAQPSEGR